MPTSLSQGALFVPIYPPAQNFPHICIICTVVTARGLPLHVLLFSEGVIPLEEGVAIPVRCSSTLYR